MGRPTLVTHIHPQLQPQPTREQIIDEFGELDRRISTFAPTVKRHKALQETIRSWYADHPADQPAIAEGTLYEIHVGCCGLKRFFSIKAKLKIFSKLGKAKAIELFSITQEAVEGELGKGEKEALLTESYSGTRDLTPILKAPAGQAA
jgi:hypothetical protein